MPPNRKRPRGPCNELHGAVLSGVPQAVAGVLARGMVDIDQGDPRGSTPLMYCSQKGHTSVARVLLERGADVSLVDDDGFGALHASAQTGHADLSKLLLKAGAPLEAKICDGCTPLHLASQKGNRGVMRTLIEAGANVDSRSQWGSTPLYVAAEERQLESVKELLRARADPQLMSDGRFVPLDMATQMGDSAVVRELVERVGISGCGGDSRGAQALRLAAEEQFIEIMHTLVDAGVVDTGTVALCGAAEYGRAGSAKLLLERCTRGSAGVRAYVNSRAPNGATPLLASVAGCRPGATVAVSAPATNPLGLVYFNGTPLALATALLRSKEIDGSPATEQQLESLEAVRRLLLTAEAVHAVSWLWPIDAPPCRIADAAAEAATTGGRAPSAPLALMLPGLRPKAGSRAVLLADFFR